MFHVTLRSVLSLPMLVVERVTEVTHDVYFGKWTKR